MTTKIAWCDETVNVVTGCTPVSAGCANCYAAGVAKRFWGERKFSDVQMHPERLGLGRLFRLRKPRRIFLNSMGDLFHDDVAEEFIFQTWNAMRALNRHQFIILTKRPERMKDVITHLSWMSDPEGAGRGYMAYQGIPGSQVLPNVWLGVTAENQAMADERIPILLETPAAVRFVSVEPQLEAVELKPEWFYDECPDGCGCRMPEEADWLDCACGGLCQHEQWLDYEPKISWIIVGAESGPKRRPFDLDWARSLRDQCQAAQVPFFLKQIHDENGKVVHMPELDGKVYAEFPEVQL